MRPAQILTVAFCLLFTNLAIAGSVSLAGRGGSTPDPLYQVWLPDYNRKNPQASVYYVSMGAAESLKNIKSGVGDFGGGEMPLTDE